MTRLATLLLAGALLFGGHAIAAEQDGEAVAADALSRAITDAANYAAGVLLTEEGYSRCEYNWREGAWVPYETAWHTGQVIWGLLEAYRLSGNAEWLAAAKRGADWWVSQEITEGALAGLLHAPHGNRLGGLINMTTITDGTPALFEMTRQTGDQRYADTAGRSGDWLLTNAYIPEHGLFYNIIDPTTGEVWKDRSPHHPDVAEPKVTQVARPNIEGFLYLDMYRHTGKQAYLDLFTDVANKLVARQGPEGFWMEFEPNDPESGKIHPRFNVWNAEALLEGYLETGNEAWLEAAKNTARAMARLQLKDGGFYYRNYLDKPPRRDSLTGSATAFSGILWLRLMQLGHGAEFLDNIHRSARWLVANQFPPGHADENLGGAFFETRDRAGPEGPQVLFRDIATAFGLRFLSAYQRHFRPETRAAE